MKKVMWVLQKSLRAFDIHVPKDLRKFTKTHIRFKK